MRRSVPALAVAASVLCTVAAHGAGDLTYVYERFGDYLESLRVQAKIPGMAAVLVGPQAMVWERTFGYRDLERSFQTQDITPFHVDGITELVTAALVLRCVEDGRLSLDDRIGKFANGLPEPDATLRQLLTHTSATPEGLVYSYRPERLNAVAAAVSACRGVSFRAAVTALLDEFAMIDSMPGADAARDIVPENGTAASTLDRYARILDRLAKPYAVDADGHASLSQYAATTLTPAAGLISTSRDLASFDLGLKQGVLLRRAESIAQAWSAPVDRAGQPLPHGIGWFVQSYNGDPVLWQFGLGDSASSSLVVTLPNRGLTLILLANSDGLVKPFSLEAGRLTASPFGRLFLGLFIR
jgi:CubicO group peptidase (beta-lactamase class C family)